MGRYSKLMRRRLDDEQVAHGRAWIAALRSGEFAQTSHRLKRIEPDGSASYCCLGVACEISGVDGWELLQIDAFGSALQYDGTVTQLSPRMQEYYGIGAEGQFYNISLLSDLAVEGEGYPPTCLTNMNDAFGCSFAQIADVLEEHVYGKDGE